jgi:hypothetical protein
MYIGLYVKYQLSYPCPMLMKLEFSRHILKNTQISNSMKLFPLGGMLFHADGTTDRHDEANSRFSQFCKHTFKQTACILQTVYKLHLHSHKKRLQTNSIHLGNKESCCIFKMCCMFHFPQNFVYFIIIYFPVLTALMT